MSGWLGGEDDGESVSIMLEGGEEIHLPPSQARLSAVIDNMLRQGHPIVLAAPHRALKKVSEFFVHFEVDPFPHDCSDISNWPWCAKFFSSLDDCDGLIEVAKQLRIWPLLLMMELMNCENVECTITHGLDNKDKLAAIDFTLLKSLWKSSIVGQNFQPDPQDRIHRIQSLSANNDLKLFCANFLHYCGHHLFHQVPEHPNFFKQLSWAAASIVAPNHSKLAVGPQVVIWTDASAEKRQQMVKYLHSIFVSGAGVDASGRGWKAYPASSHMDVVRYDNKDMIAVIAADKCWSIDHSTLAAAELHIVDVRGGHGVGSTLVMSTGEIAGDAAGVDSHLVAVLRHLVELKVRFRLLVHVASLNLDAHALWATALEDIFRTRVPHGVGARDNGGLGIEGVEGHMGEQAEPLYYWPSSGVCELQALRRVSFPLGFVCVSLSVRRALRALHRYFPHLGVMATNIIQSSQGKIPRENIIQQDGDVIQKEGEEQGGASASSRWLQVDDRSYGEVLLAQLMEPLRHMGRDTFDLAFVPETQAMVAALEAAASEPIPIFVFLGGPDVETEEEEDRGREGWGKSENERRFLDVVHRCYHEEKEVEREENEEEDVDGEAIFGARRRFVLVNFIDDSYEQFIEDGDDDGGKDIALIDDAYGIWSPADMMEHTFPQLRAAVAGAEAEAEAGDDSP